MKLTRSKKYESAKKEIDKEALTDKEYEEKIKKLVKKLKV